VTLANQFEILPYARLVPVQSESPFFECTSSYLEILAPACWT
jgi:hypothetical protein